MTGDAVRPSEVAYKAAEIMSERGFCQGTMQDKEGRVCFYGALGQALRALCVRRKQCGPDSVYWYGGDAITGTAAALVRDRTGQLDPSPSGYNDQPDTTAEDVISLLKQTAALLEEQGR